MTDDRSFSRAAAIAAIVSLPLAAGNLVAMLATVHFDLDGMTDPLVLLHAGGAAAPLWRLSMILDVLGHYLAIVPLVLLLRASPRHRSPNWVDLHARWPPPPDPSWAGARPRSAPPRPPSWSPSTRPPSASTVLRTTRPSGPTRHCVRGRCRRLPPRVVTPGRR